MGDEDQDGMTEDYRQERKQVEALDLDTEDDDFELDASDGLEEELIEDESADDEDEEVEAEGKDKTDEEAVEGPPRRKKATPPSRRRAGAKSGAGRPAPGRPRTKARGGR